MRLVVHEDAASDLDVIGKENPLAGAIILALLEELRCNPDALDTLTDHKFGERRDRDYSVSKWLEQWRKGNDLWRLKIWELEDKGFLYRIIYAYLPAPRSKYVVLGIPPRDFDYDANHPIAQRIFNAYRSL